MGVDIEALKEQLSTIKNKLAEEENYFEASEIKKAIEEKDESKIIGFLKSAGQKALEIAKATCLPIAEDAIKKALGLL